MPISVLFCDVDRTLLTSVYQLPPIVADALASLQQAGVQIVLATARSPAGIVELSQRLNVDLCVCYNGGWVGYAHTGNALFEATIERSLALDVISSSVQLGIAPLWYAKGGVYTVRADARAEHEVRITGESLLVVSINDLPAEPYKIMCARSDEQGSEFQAMRERFSGSLAVVQSNWRLLEFSPANISKRTGAEIVAAWLGVEPETCAAAGDAENDLALLRWVGLPLTVENAVAEIRSFAAFIGPSAEVGGMAAVAEWLQENNDIAAVEL